MPPDLKLVSHDNAPPAPVSTPAVVVPAPEAPKEKLQTEDFLHLQLAQQKKLTAVAEAKTALANNEKSELEYRLVVSQLFAKYGMTAADGLSESGEILRGANSTQAKGQ